MSCDVEAARKFNINAVNYDSVLGSRVILNKEKKATNPVQHTYSRKYWRGIKFGGLAVCEQTAKLKSANYIYPSFIRYRNAKTAKLKSTNFNFRRFSSKPPNIIPRQYFQLYGILVLFVCVLSNLMFVFYPGFFVTHFHAPTSMACRDTLPSDTSFLLEYLEQLPYESDSDGDKFKGCDSFLCSISLLLLSGSLSCVLNSVL